MDNYSIDRKNKWDYENGFYLTCETSRIGKLLNHLEIYKKIIELPGDVFEFGVYKGTSLIRFLTFRDLLESTASRKILGFDIFGKFPNNLSLESDIKFVQQFEENGGFGISQKELEEHINRKGFSNYELIKGDIMHTLDEYIINNPTQKISILHIDVDVYEPTKMILEKLYQRVVKGGIIILDDYPTVVGATRAVDEFISNKVIKIYKPPYNYIPSYIIKE